MKDFKSILAAYNFTDEHGHPLEACQDFLDLVDAYEEEVLTKRGVEVVQKLLRDKEPIMFAVATETTPNAPLAMFSREEWAEEWRKSHMVTGRVNSFKVRLNAVEPPRTLPTIKQMSGLIKDFTRGKSMKEYMEELSDE